MRKDVRNLYRQLLYTGREYPLGFGFFREKLKKAFMKNKLLSDSEVPAAVDRGKYVIKELEALYHIRKYRHIKAAYKKDDPES